MISRNTIFWEVDTQADFMLPGGKLYVPGAETIIPNLNRLVEAVRQGRVFLISSADAHNPDDTELRDWPAHCLKDSPGAALLPEACAPNQMAIPNEQGFVLPQDFRGLQQIILQKNTLDVFDNPNADALLDLLKRTGSPAFGPNLEFILFGVVTEHCVRRAAEGLLRRGCRIAVVTDAIQALAPEEGRKVLEDLHSRGARLINTEEALALIGVSAAGAA